MKLTIALPADVSIALRKLANEAGVTVEEAASVALRDFLIASGFLETLDLDEDTEIEGEA